MKPRIQTNPVFLAIAAALVFWGLAFSLACRWVGAGRPAGVAVPGVLDRVTGSLRSTIGEGLLNRADEYFHTGRSHERERVFRGVYGRALEGLRPREHRHAHQGEAPEVMPWLRWSTLADPGNVEAFLAAAYWMEREVGQPDRVDAIYREAAGHNPGDYRIGLDWGRSRARRGDNPGAIRLFGSSLRRWPNPLNPESDPARRDLVGLLEIRGLLLLQEGRRGPALKHLKRAQSLSPDAPGLRRWIAGIEAGDPMVEPLERMKGVLLAAPGPLHCEGHDHGSEPNPDREPAGESAPAGDRGDEFSRDADRSGE